MNTTEQLSQWLKENEGNKFARKCSISGIGMNEGWCFRGGDTYASTQEIADQIARDEYDYKDFKDMYANEGGQPDDDDQIEGDGDTYWTTWEELDEDDYWIVRDGQLINVIDGFITISIR